MSARLWVPVVLTYLLVPVLLLACGGDLGWWQAWLFGVLLVSAGVLSRVWAERRHPGLLAERRHPGLAERQGARSADVDDVKPWDRILAPLMAISISFPVAIVAGLDHRYGWSGPVPAGLQWVGFALIALGYATASWALAENRFFSSMVRIQTERGHTVCDTGPYRVVRHPGYAGNLLALPGIALALGSWWTLVPAAVALVVAVVRTALEDRTLREELPGYEDYARRVRYRLFPGLY